MTRTRRATRAQTPTVSPPGRTAPLPTRRRSRRAREAVGARCPRASSAVRVEHELVGGECLGACGATLVEIGEEITEQLARLPAQHFVIQIVRKKYACPCKNCGVRTAPAPPAPLPGSQASPEVLADTFVSKYLDAIPLARQERIYAREGLDLPRAKLARWVIGGAGVLRPLYNLIEDELLEYDIVQSDDTGIQVLKEPGRAASTRSALWIRRGGPPGRTAVLVDYRETKSAAAGASLLEGVRARTYLVVDAAQSFEAIARIHDLVPVLVQRSRAQEVRRGRPWWRARLDRGQGDRVLQEAVPDRERGEAAEAHPRPAPSSTPASGDADLGHVHRLGAASCARRGGAGPGHAHGARLPAESRGGAATVR